MALQDFYNTTNQTLILHVRSSDQRDPIHAALAARHLISKKQVQAILGPHSWEETSLVAKVGSENHVPILSFSNATPKWATELWPFLIQASSNKQNQMKAIASIVQSWEWYQVTVIYEENSSINDVLPNLFSALKDVGAEITRLVALSPFASPALSEELERLKGDQCRVFVVHMSFQLAFQLFNMARDLKMMEKDYVWITTDPITSLVHSFNASTISSMQGVLGVRSYFHDRDNKQRWHDFDQRFRKRFRLEYPKEYNHEPSTFAAQAYDATWAVAQAMRGSRSKEGKILLAKILQMGKSNRVVGFWSDGLGFSKSISEGSNYSSSMKDLGLIFWPGAPWNTPKGWTLPSSNQYLRVGVPSSSMFKQFVDVQQGEGDLGNDNFSFSGFAIEVFKATVEELRFPLPYKFFPFNGTYDELVEQIHLKKFDAVVGDVAIVANRYQHAEFTYPYTQAGLVMIVPVQSNTANKAWLFLKPFTKTMWILIVVVNIYNGFVVWLIERNHCLELNGSRLDQIGALIWLAFSTLFTLHGGSLHSHLTRMTMLVWLFVALVITQTYTANLTSMLTVQQLEPDFGALQSSNSLVGYCRGSFLKNYLSDVLGFHRNRIKSFNSQEEIAQALRSREIAAIYLEVPVANLFLARYCEDFTKVEPTYKVGGFGFAFPRGSPLLPSISEALLKVSESGELQELEGNMLESEKCTEEKDDYYNTPSLSLKSFWVLFLFTVGTSTFALVLYIIVVNKSTMKLRVIWWLMTIVIRHRHSRSGHLDSV
ncbi:hypothetical protein TIFTF001_023565 [Ficus carica]|uniref:Glutamate receptor n=1 Tax=Ficus carica TaxID=3494 RepID=A0AA88AX02_FICCA|nr:hypothetical protein TIFTF001_023565 [Ficus carica]